MPILDHLTSGSEPIPGSGFPGLKIENSTRDRARPGHVTAPMNHSTAFNTVGASRNWRIASLSVMSITSRIVSRPG
jgi:hypothetical protein